MTGNETYASAWSDRRRRLRMSYLSALGLLPVCGIAAWFFPEDTPRMTIVLSYSALMLAAAWWAAAFPCPRCRKPFNGKVIDTFFNSARYDAKKCASCSLPLDGGPQDFSTK